MPRANHIALPCLAALLAGAALIHGAPLPVRAQGQPPAPATPSSPVAAATKACADRWNAMKAAGTTGDVTYRDFYQSCMAGAAQAGQGGAGATATKPATPTGPAAAAARPTIRQCADLWNELKAKNETGNLVYRDFAQQCLAGTGPAQALAPDADKAATAAGSGGKTAAPAKVTTLAPPPPDGLQKPSDEADREAVNRCNGEWQAYKARHNLSGAKAWHVFMARCLP